MLGSYAFILWLIMYLCLFVAVESADITFDTQKFLKNDDKLT